MADFDNKVGNGLNARAYRHVATNSYGKRTTTSEWLFLSPDDFSKLNRSIKELNRMQLTKNELQRNKHGLESLDVESSAEIVRKALQKARRIAYNKPAL
jgi:hypothetical protein